MLKTAEREVGKNHLDRWDHIYQMLALHNLVEIGVCMGDESIYTFDFINSKIAILANISGQISMMRN